MQVPHVCFRKTAAACGTTDDCKDDVDDRDGQHQERYEDRGQKEVGLSVRRLRVGVGPSTHDARGHRHQQTKQQCSAITHEDARRIEVEREESHAHTNCDHGNERPDVRLWQQVARREVL